MASPASTETSAPLTARTAFKPLPVGRDSVLDGAWWPRSRDLAAELPALLATLAERDVVVARVAYGPDSWEPAGRKARIAGRVIALGWFRTIDPHLVSVTSLDARDRLDLLVVPPDDDKALADRAFALVLDGHDRDGASATLAAAAADSSSRS
jgi:hypothetical protein